MTTLESRTDADLLALADSVLLPGFHGPVAPDWLRRRVSGSLGGVCLFGSNIGSAEQLLALTDSLRAERENVVISVDEEGGGVTRLDAATGSRFPGVAALGRVDDVELTEQVGHAVGVLVGAAGITLNFAPCADVMTDQLNPVIGIRAFGSDPALVARHTAAFIRGHQAAGVAACAKHYPGHGDTDVDTHLTVAVIDDELESLRSTALLPFIAAIDAGVASVMAGHLLVPAVDGLPASVSGRWLTEILRQEMGFTGPIVTDALDMAAIASQYGMVSGSVMAIEAGADLLCLGAHDAGPELLDAIGSALVTAVRSGRIPESRLVQAAQRALSLAARPGSSAPIDDDADRRVSMEAASRALHVAGELPQLQPGVVVVRCEAARNFAIGVVPWGPLTAIPAGFDAREYVLTRDNAVVPIPLTDVPQVLVVTSDVAEADAPAVASFGSGLANNQAVVDLLLGAVPR